MALDIGTFYARPNGYEGKIRHPLFSGSVEFCYIDNSRNGTIEYVLRSAGKDIGTASTIVHGSNDWYISVFIRPRSLDPIIVCRLLKDRDGRAFRLWTADDF